jgi:hypothetical protein
MKSVLGKKITFRVSLLSRYGRYIELAWSERAREAALAARQASAKAKETNLPEDHRAAANAHSNVLGHLYHTNDGDTEEGRQQIKESGEARDYHTSQIVAGGKGLSDKGRFKDTVSHSEALTPKQKDAVKSWSHGEDAKIKEADFTGKGDAKTLGRVKTLHKILEKAPLFKGEVYRGTPKVSTEKEGDTIQMRGLTSFSHDKEEAKGFARGRDGEKTFTLYHVQKHKGVPALPDDPTKTMDYHNEGETLIGKDRKFKVAGKESMTMKGHKGEDLTGHVVHLEEI